jgi:competence protein ComEA
MRNRSFSLAVLAFLALAPVSGFAQAGGTIDLNTATKEQLVAFKGIGQAYADKIIAGRPFKMRSELVGRHIMPATEYLKIKAKLTPTAEAAMDTPAATPPAPTIDNADRLNLNTATREQLSLIGGIGQAYADKIIAGRPYKERSELVKRNILPALVYGKIKEKLIANP